MFLEHLVPAPRLGVEQARTWSRLMPASLLRWITATRTTSSREYRRRPAGSRSGVSSPTVSQCRSTFVGSPNRSATSPTDHWLDFMST